jgi:hypothetical protein
MADIIIDIASEFTGTKAFTKAQSATDKLEKGVKRLGRTLGVSLGTAAVLSFAKASVKAAAADQKAQQQLALALKNVGLGRDAASAESYIQKLQSEFGVVDDLLRPAYQRLAVATHDSNESQKLLNLSLDISASTGKDLDAVTSALSKAYLGSNTALSKLGVGISKADLKAKSFNDIVNQLTTTFAGAATSAANTYQGSIDKLAVASNNVKETIGIGIIDSLKLLGEDQNIDTATAKMQQFATATNETLVGISSLISKLKSNKLGGAILGTFGDILANLQPFATFRKEGQKVNARKNTGGQQGAPAELLALSKYSIVQDKVVANAKTLAKLSSQQIKDLKLKSAIEKANLALGKGGNIFDMDAIQLNAALISQAEQLGKATTGAQILQIANDTARLKVKQDILALEAAIASQDQAAIEAATKKLNADMAILGSLQGQSIKLLDIKSILDTLKPKDLINLDNLQEALRLLGLINLANTGSKTASTSSTAAPSVAGMTPATTTAGINANVASLGGVVSVIANNGTEFIKLVDGLAPVFQAIEDVGTFNALVNSFASGTIGSFGAGSVKGTEGSLFNSGAVGSRDININVTTGIGDPNAIAEAVNQVIQDAVDRGTLRGGSY